MMSEIKKERNANVDLFRLFSMFMVVGLHVLGQGGILSSSQTLTLKGEAIWFFEIAMFCAVNCFALISGYLGVNSKRKTYRLVNMTFQVLFYCTICSLGFIAYSFIANNPLNIRFLVKSMFPTLFGGYWYISAYFCLCLFAPLLDALLDLPRLKLRKAMLAVVILFCCFSRIQGRVTGLENGYTFLWISVLYLIGGYIAKYDPFGKWSIKFNFIGYLACVVLTLVSKIIIEIVTIKVLGRAVRTDLLIAYTSPTILLCSVFLFNIFMKIRIKKGLKRVICYVAPASLGVYVIHCQPILFDNVLKGSFAFIGDYFILVIILVSFCITAAIFGLCIIIDLLRIQLFRVCGINKLANKCAVSIDRLISKLVREEQGEQKI